MNHYELLIQKINKLEERVSELESANHSMFVVGTVIEVNYEKQLANVKIGDKFETGMVPFFQKSGKSRRESDPLEVSEQVLVLNLPTGEGFILGSLTQLDFKINNSKDKHIISWYDENNFIEYNKTSNTFLFKIKNLEFDIDSFSVKSKKSFNVKNGEADLMKSLIEGIAIIQKSNTNTVKGPRPLVPAVTELTKPIKDLGTIKG